VFKYGFSDFFTSIERFWHEAGLSGTDQTWLSLFRRSSRFGRNDALELTAKFTVTKFNKR